MRDYYNTVVNNCLHVSINMILGRGHCEKDDDFRIRNSYHLILCFEMNSFNFASRPKKLFKFDTHVGHCKGIARKLLATECTRIFKLTFRLVCKDQPFLQLVPNIMKPCDIHINIIRHSFHILWLQKSHYLMRLLCWKLEI